MNRITVTGPISKKLIDTLYLAGFFLGMAMLGLWYVVFSEKVLTALWAQLEHMALNLLIIAATVVVHEVVHYICYPSGDNARFGFEKKFFAPYTQYEGAIIRHRYIFVVCAPFLVLTVAPLLLSLIAGFSMWLALVSVVNITLSAADLYMGYCMYKKAPKGSFIDYDEKGYFATIVNKS